MGPGAADRDGRGNINVGDGGVAFVLAAAAASPGGADTVRRPQPRVGWARVPVLLRLCLPPLPRRRAARTLRDNYSVWAARLLLRPWLFRSQERGGSAGPERSSSAESPDQLPGRVESVQQQICHTYVCSPGPFSRPAARHSRPAALRAQLVHLVRALRAGGLFTAVALTQPFAFEGARKAQAARRLVGALEGAAHLVAVIDQARRGLA